MDTNVCQYSTFDLFSRPPTEIGLEEVQEHEILPLTALQSNTSTIEFSITGAGDEYIDLSSLRLYLQVTVTDVENKAPEAGKVRLIELWPQAMFRQVDLYMNGTLVSTSSNLYAFTAFVSTILGFPKDVKDHQINVLEHLKGWDVEPKKNSNEALIRLHLPLCQQPRFIPNGVSINLRLLRSNNAFVFANTDGTKEYNISIDKCRLFVKKIKPSAALLLQHVEEIGKRNAAFPIETISTRFITLPKGLKDHDLNNVCQGQLPSEVYIGIVKSEDFSGISTTNPYKFAPHKLASISLQSNGKSIPEVPLETDYEKGFFRRAYHTLLDTIQGPCADRESVGISAADYTSKLCFYGFSLSQSLSGPNESVPRRETGYLNAKLRFSEALKDNLNAIFFLVYQNTVEIDSARNVYCDY